MVSTFLFLIFFTFDIFTFDLIRVNPYDEAASDEIRQLFHRPNIDRFSSHSSDNNENIFNFYNDQLPEDDDKAPKDWVEGIDNEANVRLPKSGMLVVA